MTGPWYITREDFKLARSIKDTSDDYRIDNIIASSTRRVSNRLERDFIPYIETKRFPWPPHLTSASYRLWLETDLISITTIQLRALDSTPLTLAASDYFLEPFNSGPPYRYLELDVSNSNVFGGGLTWQRSILVTGLWGYSDTREVVGTLPSNISSSTTTITLTSPMRIGVGDTLYIDSEQIFVSDITNTDTTAILMNTITADKGVRLISISNTAKIRVGEIISINAEHMYISSINGSDVSVIRGESGTSLSSHVASASIYAPRKLTVERAAGGTTAAAHVAGANIHKYIIPDDVKNLCMAEAMDTYMQEEKGYGRTIGAGESEREFKGEALSSLRKEAERNYYIRKMAAL